MNSNTAPFDITVIIPSYNTLSDLSKCVHNLRGICDISLFVIVIDNNSTDGSREFLRNCNLVDILIQNEINIGFSGAVNKGLLMVKTDEALILNADAAVDGVLIKSMIRIIRSSPELAGVGIPLLFPDCSKEILEGYGDAITLSLRPVRVGHCVPVASYKPLKEYSTLSGAACLFSIHALQMVGYFDESFFLYIEDVDLSLRLRRYGFKLATLHGLFGFHKGGASSGGRKSNITIYYSTRNYIWMIRKNFYLRVLLILAPFIISSLIIEMFRNIRIGKHKPWFHGLLEGLLINTSVDIGKNKFGLNIIPELIRNTCHVLMYRIQRYILSIKVMFKKISR